MAFFGNKALQLASLLGRLLGCTSRKWVTSGGLLQGEKKPPAQTATDADHPIVSKENFVFPSLPFSFLSQQP